MGNDQVSCMSGPCDCPHNGEEPHRSKHSHEEVQDVKTDGETSPLRSLNQSRDAAPIADEPGFHPSSSSRSFPGRIFREESSDSSPLPVDCAVKHNMRRHINHEEPATGKAPPSLDSVSTGDVVNERSSSGTVVNERSISGDIVDERSSSRDVLNARSNSREQPSEKQASSDSSPESKLGLESPKASPSKMKPAYHRSSTIFSQETTGTSKTAGSEGAKSACTEALRSSQYCEWWMAESFDPDDDDDGFQLYLAETWCGSEPRKPLGARRTSCCQQGIFAPTRQYCAGKRHRYQLNGFDLDMAYITSRVIAMGFPGKGTHACFRNPHSEVKKFLEQHHVGNFRIYNLCVEKSHSENGFPEFTERFPMADHCPPTFAQLYEFCNNVKEWLERKAENVIAVHCKAGKGRTGTMICALLVFAGAVASAYDALRWYECIRGGFRAGVTIPAQIRRVAMFDRWLKSQCNELRSDPMGVATPHRISSLSLGPLLPSFTGQANALPTLFVQVGMASRIDNDLRKVTHWHSRTAVCCDEEHMLRISLPEDGPVWTDCEGLLLVRIWRPTSGCVQRAKRLKIKSWWHYAFLQQGTSGTKSGSSCTLSLAKAWIDGLQKDMVRNKLTPEEFKLVVGFLDVKDATSDCDNAC